MKKLGVQRQTLGYRGHWGRREHPH